jgi:hydrogenase expression/formation protein HypE
MVGATPMYITAGFILEEGLDIQLLSQVVESMQKAAQEAGVQVVAGDTKVVQKGKADGIYINTAGLGWIPAGVQVSGANACPGDALILSGSIGDHGIAVLEARGELGFISGVNSDVAPLNHMVGALIENGCHVHSLRDPTRGGLATTLNEMARQSKVAFEIDESLIPIDGRVAAACEMLGLDPLYVANEGKLVAVVAAADSKKAVEIMRSFDVGRQATVIGSVAATPASKVLVKTSIGARRILDMLSGEMLPRIC